MAGLTPAGPEGLRLEAAAAAPTGPGAGQGSAAAPLARSPGAEGHALPEPLTRIELALPRARSGKVRECFDLGDRLLLVATDRISAFDCVFARGIPGKGSVLTGVSAFWFGLLDAGGAGSPPIPHHLLSTDAAEVAREAGLTDGAARLLSGRTMLVRKAEPVPVECVVRGYLEGSALAEYERTRRVAGVLLPPGLRRADRLRHPLFTPAVKATTGHDENITFDEIVRRLGPGLAETLRDLSLRLYRMGSEALAERGLLLADTKFEFGLPGGGAGPQPEASPPDEPALPEEDARAGVPPVVLIDELLTPDSSRMWEASAWQPGRAQPIFDKQPLRDYLEDLVRQGRWDKRPPAPDLPDHIVRETAARYAEAHRRITGSWPEGWPAGGTSAAANALEGGR